METEIAGWQSDSCLCFVAGRRERGRERVRAGSSERGKESARDPEGGWQEGEKDSTLRVQSDSDTATDTLWRTRAHAHARTHITVTRWLRDAHACRTGSRRALDKWTKRWKGRIKETQGQPSRNSGSEGQVGSAGLAATFFRVFLCVP